MTKTAGNSKSVGIYDPQSPGGLRSFHTKGEGGWGGGIGGNLAGFHDTLSLRARKRHKEWFFGIGHQLSNERRQKKDSFHFYTKNCVIKNKHRPALVKVAIFAGFIKTAILTRSGLGLFLITQFLLKT